MSFWLLAAQAIAETFEVPELPWRKRARAALAGAEVVRQEAEDREQGVMVLQMDDGSSCMAASALVPPGQAYVVVMRGVIDLDG